MEKRRAAKVNNLFNTIEQYDSDVFFSHFRMTPHTFAVSIVIKNQLFII